MVGDTDPKHTSLSGLELFQQLRDGEISPSPWAVLADLRVEDLALAGAGQDQHRDDVAQLRIAALLDLGQQALVPGA